VAKGLDVDAVSQVETVDKAFSNLKQAIEFYCSLGRNGAEVPTFGLRYF